MRKEIENRNLALRRSDRPEPAAPHVVLPGNDRHRRARRKRRRNDLPLQRSGQERLRGRPVAVVPITGFVDTSRPHGAEHHATLDELTRFRKAVSGGGKLTIRKQAIQSPICGPRVGCKGEISTSPTDVGSVKEVFTTL